MPTPTDTNTNTDNPEDEATQRDAEEHAVVEWKSFAGQDIEFKDASEQFPNGRITGYFAVFNSVDRVGDVLEEGAFRDALPDFRREGTIIARHGSVGGARSDPVAFPIQAKEDQKGVWIDAPYHGTQYAQEERRIAQERKSAGLDVPFSFGYIVNPRNVEYVGGVRHIKAGGIKHLLEVSTNVTAPVNPLAIATSVKAMSLDGMTYADQADAVLDAVRELERRTRDILTMRQAEHKAGRMLSGANMSRLQSVHEAMTGAHSAMSDCLGTLGDLLEQADPAQEKALRVRADALQEVARFLVWEATFDGLLAREGSKGA